MTHRFLNATAWQGYILGPSAMTNLSLGATDAAIETYLRANAAPNGHIVGTASMSPKGAKYGVVDPDLTVKGVKGLRIVDASVLVSVFFCSTFQPPNLRISHIFRRGIR